MIEYKTINAVAPATPFTPKPSQNIFPPFPRHTLLHQVPTHAALNKWALLIPSIVDDLCKRPWTPAAVLGAKYRLQRAELAAIYKTIQMSDAIQQAFANSANRDYFDIVKNHFDRKAFEVVFFVGLSCPLRCRFCPSVTIRNNQTRVLKKYPGRKEQQITREEIARVFVDIGKMRESGSRVLVKISGGLEPLTNPEQIGWILDQAQQHGVPTQMFTNGVLLNTPGKRELALRADHVRISVSAPDRETFQELCLGPNARAEQIFARLTSNIRQFIAQRNAAGATTLIGINSVLGPSNWHSLDQLIDFAAAMGADYLDVKPDYFHKDPQWMEQLGEKIAQIRSSLSGGRKGGTRIQFAGSIMKDNVYNVSFQGTTRLDSQCEHKVFITPFGECTPVHCGAFPQATQAKSAQKNPYILGKVSPETGILDLLARVGDLPEVSFDQLNPYERILDLEAKRRRNDAALGLSRECSPYDLSCRTRSLAPTAARAAASVEAA